MQQLGLQIMSVEQLPVENVITASYCKKAYKISLAPGSFYTFTISCLVTIAWCLLRLIPTIFKPAPILSLFSEANILSKVPKNVRNDRLSKLGPGATSKAVEEILGEVNIKIEKRMQWDDGSWEMNDMDIPQI